ncbi:hypothetical protein [Haloglomus salinum]|jgi:hypothetical protein|uniref:hypothetical protein n=1 Tax=Haloglomus salinum TaxID=2962673 RepID=UPI0020C99239|nr:hypothetical protein [Haloglomus salinum]
MDWNGEYARSTIIPNYGLTSSFNVSSSGNIDYEVIVRSGAGVSVYIVDETELQNYQQGYNFGSYTNATHKNVTRVENSFPVNPGNYGLIIENPTMSNIVVDVAADIPGITGSIQLS